MPITIDELQEYIEKLKTGGAQASGQPINGARAGQDILASTMPGGVPTDGGNMPSAGSQPGSPQPGGIQPGGRPTDAGGNLGGGASGPLWDKYFDDLNRQQPGGQPTDAGGNMGGQPSLTREEYLRRLANGEPAQNLPGFRYLSSTADGTPLLDPSQLGTANVNLQTSPDPSLQRNMYPWLQYGYSTQEEWQQAMQDEEDAENRRKAAEAQRIADQTAAQQAAEAATAQETYVAWLDRKPIDGVGYEDWVLSNPMLGTDASGKPAADRPIYYKINTDGSITYGGQTEKRDTYNALGQKVGETEEVAGPVFTDNDPPADTSEKLKNDKRYNLIGQVVRDEEEEVVGPTFETEEEGGGDEEPPPTGTGAGNFNIADQGIPPDLTPEELAIMLPEWQNFNTAGLQLALDTLFTDVLGPYSPGFSPEEKASFREEATRQLEIQAERLYRGVEANTNERGVFTPGGITQRIKGDRFEDIILPAQQDTELRLQNQFIEREAADKQQRIENISNLVSQENYRRAQQLDEQLKLRGTAFNEFFATLDAQERINMQRLMANEAMFQRFMDLVSQYNMTPTEALRWMMGFLGPAATNIQNAPSALDYFQIAANIGSKFAPIPK